MLGKQKCRILKEIRQRIADENEIPFVTRECRFRGECSGTCPRCESELRYLEQQLARRASMGKRVSVVALCAGMAFASAGCGSAAGGPVPEEIELSGEVGPYYEEPGKDPEPEILVTTGIVPWNEETEDDLTGSDLLPEDAENYCGRDAIPTQDPEPVPIETDLSGDVAYPFDD